MKASSEGTYPDLDSAIAACTQEAQAQGGSKKGCAGRSKMGQGFIQNVRSGLGKIKNLFNKGGAGGADAIKGAKEFFTKAVGEFKNKIGPALKRSQE